MLKLAKLNIEINNILDFYVSYNQIVHNFLYNNLWVTDIGAKYFEIKVEELEKLIDENINYEDEKNLLFLEDINNSIDEYIKHLSIHLDNFSSFNFSEINYPISLNFPSNPPQNSSQVINEPNPSNYFDDRFEDIVGIIEGFFNLSRVNQISNSQQALNSTLLISPEIEESDLDSIYAKAHLVYIMSLHKEMLKGVSLKIESILKVVGIRQSYVDENFHGDLGLENVRLDFNLSKFHLGYLFYNLYEIGIIAKDETDIKDERTKLKNYINSANMYYLDKKSKFCKVEKITREMKVVRENTKEIQDEILFLESFVSKLNARVGTLNETLVSLKDRGY
jgi:hypothetical protein